MMEMMAAITVQWMLDKEVIFPLLRWDEVMMAVLTVMILSFLLQDKVKMGLILLVMMMTLMILMMMMIIIKMMLMMVTMMMRLILLVMIMMILMMVLMMVMTITKFLEQ